MLGTKLSFYTTPRAFRGAARWGTLCAALALLPLMAGCPFGQNPCSNNPCDDSDACTTDTCTRDNTVDVGYTCTNTAVDCMDQVCNPDDGSCVDCVADSDCDNGTFCDGAETCGTDNTCAAGTDPCDAVTEQCNEDTASCDTLCSTDADCDDGVYCNGSETCGADGVCVAGTDPCTDDGAYCNGTESCDEDTTSCVSSGDPCDTSTETCNEDTDSCDAGTPCETDADCVEDPDLFCNGTESCDADTMLCVHSGDPCAEGEECDEDTDTCTNTTPGETFTLTLAIDSGADFTGGAGDDIFNAPLVFNSGTGTNIPSLQTSDSIDGGAGTDTLNATLSAAAGTLTPTIANIEWINWTDFGTGTTTLAGTNVTGATNFVSKSSTQNVVATNLANLVDIGITNSTANLSVSFLSAATTSNTDEMTLALSSATGGTTTNQTVTITSGTTNGVETLNITSTGADNFIKQVTQGTGNTMATVNVSGDTQCQINDALDNSITTESCEGAAGGCLLSLGNGDNTFTGGPGDDTVAFSNADFTSGDTVDGGDGTDTLSLLSADADNATSALTNVSNLEALTISDAMAGAVNATYYGSIATVNLNAGITGGNTLTIASGTNVIFGFNGATNDSGGNNTLAVSGLATTDTCTTTYNDSDSGGSTTFSGIETVNLVSNVNESGAAADGGSNTFTGAFTLPDTTGSSLVITGTEDVAFSAAVTARNINGAGFGQAILMTLNTTGATTTSTVATGGGTIMGGTGNDTLVGSTAGDTITGNGGKDVIQPGRGIDTVSFSDGSCILDLEDLATAQVVAANRVTVSGFTANGTEYTTSNEVDGIRFDNIGTNGDLSDGAAAAEFQTVTTPANVTVSAGVSLVELSFEVSSSVDLDADTTGATLLTACGATTGTTACTFTTQANDDDVVIIAYQSGNAYIYHGNGAGGDTSLIGSEMSLIAVVTGDVTVGGFVASQIID